MPEQQLSVPAQPNELTISFAKRAGVEPGQVMRLLRETALKSRDPVTNEEVAAFMIIAEKYELSPWTREIYGFMSKGKMQYVVGVDGWITLCNRHPAFNGIEFDDQFAGEQIRAITCRIHRKDRTLPIVVTEYISECRRDSDPWKSHPIRMLRHKAMIQCARIAFGFAGVMDEDEAEGMEGFNVPTGRTLEATTQPVEQDEAGRLMSELKWNRAMQDQARRNHNGRPEELLDYLKKETEKLKRVATKSKGKVVEAKPAQVETQAEIESVAEEQPQQDEPQSETQPAVSDAADWM